MAAVQKGARSRPVRTTAANVARYSADYPKDVGNGYSYKEDQVSQHRGRAVCPASTPSLTGQGALSTPRSTLAGARTAPLHGWISPSSR